MQCQTLQAVRDETITTLNTLKGVLREDIHRACLDTQTDLHKVQETVHDEVQRSTHNVVQQLLSIPPPPPPPPRPWLYLPYGRQTRSGEAYQACKARQEYFWSRK